MAPLVLDSETQFLPQLKSDVLSSRHNQIAFEDDIAKTPTEPIGGDYTLLFTISLRIAASSQPILRLLSLIMHNNPTTTVGAQLLLTEYHSE